MELRFASGEGSHTDGSVPNLNKRQLKTIPPEEALVLGDVHSGLPLAEGARCHGDFGQGLGSSHRLRRDRGQQHKREAQKLLLSSHSQMIG